MKQVVLVAGIDYEFKGVEFRIFSGNRLKRLLAKNTAKEDMTFHLFDVKSGEVERHDVTYPGGKQTIKLTKSAPFTKLGKANYNRTVVAGEAHYDFKNGQRGHLSVTDVYAAVQQIGRDAPGTLLELSFFSHAWHGGPILVNSFDDGQLIGPPLSIGGPPSVIVLSPAERDPDDYDPRPKDFSPPNMDAAKLKQFKDAFRADGYCWNWGCAFPRVVHEILHKLETHKDYRASGLGDDDLFVFTNFRAEHLAILSPLFGPFPNPRRVELKFKHLKYFFCRVTEASYTHRLAANSGVKTYGGVMGTYSEYDTGSLPLMNVYKGFSRHIQFYKNYLGFSFDPEGRRYGEYKPACSCVAPGP